jgi:hypothetical protein
LGSVSQSLDVIPESVYLLTGDGDIFYASEPEMLNSHARAYPAIYRSYAAAPKNGGSVALEGNSVLSSALSADRRYVVVTSLDGTEILRSTNGFAALSALGGAAGLAISFAVAFAISLRIYNNNVIRLVACNI